MLTLTFGVLFCCCGDSSFTVKLSDGIILFNTDCLSSSEHLDI